MNIEKEKKLREKLECKLLKVQEEALKTKSLKELIQEYYAFIKKHPTKNYDKLLTKKIREAIQIVIAKKEAEAAVKKTIKEADDDLDFNIDSSDENVPVEKELDDEDFDFNDAGEEDEDEYDLDNGDKDFDFDDEDFDLGDNDEEDDSEEEEETEDEFDFEAGEEEEEEEEDEEEEEEKEENDGETDQEELDSEIEDNLTPEITEAEKKKLRMDRIKAKASKFGKHGKVNEEESGNTATSLDPSAGVDATLAGDKELFDAIPDLENGIGTNKKTVPGSNLGTQDASKAPNISMQKTDAPKWSTDGNPEAAKAMKQTVAENKNVGGTSLGKKSESVKIDNNSETAKITGESPWSIKTKKVERLNYKKLMQGDYLKNNISE